MNAVIYARYSSYGQNEQTIETQLEICEKYARNENLNIIGHYIDRALTGTNDERPQFQKMIRDSQKKLFDVIVVYRLDRFARNRRDSANYKYYLGLNGVFVHSATEYTKGGEESLLLEGFLEIEAELYSKRLSRRVRDGQSKSIEKGQFLGGNIPFGFKVVDLKVQIDVKQADIVRYIFNAHADGLSKKQIVTELNQKGYLTNKGKPFVLNSIQKMLKNEKYIGHFYYQNKLYTNIYPQIVDEQTFNKVQEKLKANMHHGTAFRGEKIKYLLSGKIYCGLCGSSMVGIRGNSKSGNVYFYYACANKYKNKACVKKAERKDFLEWYVCEQTMLYILQPTRMDFIADIIVNQYEKEFNNFKVKELESDIAKIEKDIDNIVNDYIGAPQLIKDKLNEKAILLETQLNESKVELAKMRISCESQITREEVLYWLKTFANKDIEDEIDRSHIIRVFINSVYLYDDKIVIYYNINKNSKQVSFIDTIKELDSLDESSQNKKCEPLIKCSHVCDNGGGKGI